MSASATEAGRDGATIARLVDDIRSAPKRKSELVGLLSETNPIYGGMSTREAERLRGYVLASYACTGLHEEAMPFILEELATGSDPYSVAAAGRAMRAADWLPDNAISLLPDAIARIEGNDDFVQFESFTDAGPAAAGTTALVDMLDTVAMLGQRAASLDPFLARMADRPDTLMPDVLAAVQEARRRLAPGPAGRGCCSHEARAIAPVRPPTINFSREIGSIELQDQSGARFRYEDFFHGRPSVVTFFYTRCMNPEKCSLTITKLSWLQRSIRGLGLHGAVNVAAFTYDPEFDDPDRLRSYGSARGMAYDDRNRLIRVVGSLAPIREYFELGVGFGPSTVNRHRIELLVLDWEAHVRDAFTRVQWSGDDVLGSLSKFFCTSPSRQSPK